MTGNDLQFKSRNRKKWSYTNDKFPKIDETLKRSHDDNDDGKIYQIRAIRTFHGIYMALPSRNSIQQPQVTEFL